MMEGQGQGRLAGNILRRTAHADSRMDERNIDITELIRVADTGETIETYPARESSLPCELVLGWIDGRPIHVLLGYNSDEREYRVITLYEPDLANWRPGFRRRRR